MKYISIKTLRQTRRKSLMVYLTLQQKREVIEELGDSALVLLEFYLLKSGNDKYTFEDELVAKALGWTTRKVQRYRLELTKANLYKQVRMTNGKDEMIQTIIGNRWIKD